jgi:hypothetical protein
VRYFGEKKEVFVTRNLYRVALLCSRSTQAHKMCGRRVG